MPLAPARPAPRGSAAPAAGPLPGVLVLAGSTAGAGTTTTAAILAASVAALGRPAELHDAADGAAPASLGALGTPGALHVVDAGARLDAARAALARNPGAALLVVTGADPAPLAAAHALVKAAGVAAGGPVEVVVVGAEPAAADAAFARLDAAARHFLGRPLRLAAAVPADPSLAVALAAGMPVSDAAAGSPAAAALQALAARGAPATGGAAPGFAPA